MGRNGFPCHSNPWGRLWNSTASPGFQAGHCGHVTLPARPMTTGYGSAHDSAISNFLPGVNFIIGKACFLTSSIMVGFGGIGK
ncbi:hypothetical protein PoB_007525100 [Plakobranchus ocellatus]|uniref:Uncharacterized protein n=1 Tax=Plakobranchus ocellatus TaxID=259542 RepID=A0AAV4DY13_9GAST|nr:hypothetical protein PoB_007525100 [Plakobranchus ocellatus]